MKDLTDQQMADMLGQPVLSATKKTVAEPSVPPGLMAVVAQIRQALKIVPPTARLHFPVRDPNLPHSAIRGILTREENERVRFE